jgi:hypothetical protein
MHVQRQVSQPPGGLDDRESVREIGHKVPVHHVQVQSPDAGLFQPSDLPLQVAKIAQRMTARLLAD